MKRFVVRKNTLPYVHQWTVIDTKTGGKITEHKTEKDADNTCEILEKHGIPDSLSSIFKRNIVQKSNNAIQAAEKLMEKPEGDPPPKPPRHSNTRKVELD